MTYCSPFPLCKQSNLYYTKYSFSYKHKSTFSCMFSDTNYSFRRSVSHENRRYHCRVQSLSQRASLPTEKAKEITGADFAVVVMSGDFTQRGTPAVFDKYTRCRLSLLAGADLCIELPVVYATASAELLPKGRYPCFPPSVWTPCASAANAGKLRPYGKLHPCSLRSRPLTRKP